MRYPFVGRALLSRRLADCPGPLPFPLVLFLSELAGAGEGNGPSPSTPVNWVCGCRIWRRIAGVVIVAGDEVQIQIQCQPAAAAAIAIQYPYNLACTQVRSLARTLARTHARNTHAHISLIIHDLLSISSQSGPNSAPIWPTFQLHPFPRPTP